MRTRFGSLCGLAALGACLAILPTRSLAQRQPENTLLGMKLMKSNYMDVLRLLGPPHEIESGGPYLPTRLTPTPVSPMVAGAMQGGMPGMGGGLMPGGMPGMRPGGMAGGSFGSSSGGMMPPGGSGGMGGQSSGMQSLKATPFGLAPEKPKSASGPGMMGASMGMPSMGGMGGPAGGSGGGNSGLPESGSRTGHLLIALVPETSPGSGVGASSGSGGMGGGGMGGGGGKMGGMSGPSMGGGGGMGGAQDEDLTDSTSQTWWYHYPARGLHIGIFFSGRGNVTQIQEFGYSGGGATRTGLHLGSALIDVLKKYNWTGDSIHVGDYLAFKYGEDYHVAFQLVNQRVVGITIGAVR